MKKRFTWLFLFVFLIFCLPAAAYASASYTNDQLCGMAKQHYKNQYGQEPPVVQVDHESGNEVVLHLYEFTSGHTATWDWYTVNRNTGKGTNFMGERIDLSPYAPASNTSSGSGLPFLDVRQSDSYYEGVRYVYENGLFNGTSSTAFSPNGSMNRAMLATVLHRLAGKPAAFGYSSFNDVKSGSYYENAVAWASARGVVNGTSNTTFSPQNPITHEQMAVMLYRYAVLYLGMDSTGAASLNAYPDGGQVGAYAKKAVQWCVSKGIITGGRLSPKSNATRAEVAEMLYRFSKLPKGTGGYRQVLDVLIKNFGQYSPGSRSMYYDMTGDGMEELFCIYQASQGAERAAIYTISGGKPVRLMDEYACGIASVPLANLGVIAKGGKNYVCLQSENGGYSHPEEYRGGTYSVYAISGTNLALTQQVQYEIRQSHNGLRSDVVMIENGQRRSMAYSEYQSWLNSWTWIAKISN